MPERRASELVVAARRSVWLFGGFVRSTMLESGIFFSNSSVEMRSKSRGESGPWDSPVVPQHQQLASSSETESLT